MSSIIQWYLLQSVGSLRCPSHGSQKLQRIADGVQTREGDEIGTLASLS